MLLNSLLGALNCLRQGGVVLEVLDNLLLLVGVEDHADDATGKVGLDR